MNVSAQQINKIIKGQQNLTFETVGKLEDALGISLMEIIAFKSTNEIKTIPLNTCFPAQNLGYEGLADMVGLQQLNEASILANLHFRFNGDRIYTYTGSILVSINPYKTLPIYGPNAITLYRGKALGVAPPHVFAIADTSYQSMITEFTNQSIMIRYYFR